MTECIAPLKDAAERRLDLDRELASMTVFQLEENAAELAALPSSPARDRCLERVRQQLAERETA